jgi:lysozyme
MAKLNQKTSANLYIFTLLMLVGITTATFYITSAPFRLKRFHYAGFGIPMPSNYSIHGIDVSHYQSNINWQDVKQMEYKHIKIGFCFIKATEGTDKVDNNYINNWYQAKQAEIPIGAYHFFYAGISAKLQAENFIAIVNLEKNDLPPVLDVEQANDVSNDKLLQSIQDWLDAVEQAYQVKPIIYTNIDFYNAYLLDKFDNYPLWIANYFDTDSPAINRNWTFWQHSESGHVNGIDGYVDFNVFSGDSSAFASLLIK